MLLTCYHRNPSSVTNGNHAIKRNQATSFPGKSGSVLVDIKGPLTDLLKRLLRKIYQSRLTLSVLVSSESGCVLTSNTSALGTRWQHFGKIKQKPCGVSLFFSFACSCSIQQYMQRPMKSAFIDMKESLSLGGLECD